MFTNSISPTLNSQPHTLEPNNEDPALVSGNSEPMKLMLKDGSLKELHPPSNTVINPLKPIDSSPPSISTPPSSENGEVYVPPQKRSHVSAADSVATAKATVAIREEKRKAELGFNRKYSCSTRGNKIPMGKKGTMEAKERQSKAIGKAKQYAFQKEERALDRPWR